ncbi:hypothetical protein BIW11_14224, partial [Tropilaelaps mercedesae]
MRSPVMLPFKLLFAAILVHQACFSEEMEAHLGGAVGPKVDVSVQGGNPFQKALGSNIASLFNPMGAVNAAFSALN